MKQERITIRISKDFKKLVEKQASRNNRNMSNYIENLIKKDVEKDMKKAVEVYGEKVEGISIEKHYAVTSGQGDSFQIYEPMALTKKEAEKLLKDYIKSDLDHVKYEELREITEDEKFKIECNYEIIDLIEYM